MKISTKVLLAILLVCMLMFLGTYLGSQYLAQNYLKLEDKTVIDNIKRTHQAIDQMVTFVATVASSWSLWDDAYQFAEKPTQKFIDNAYSVEVLATTNLDMVLVYGIAGNTIFTRAINPEESKEIVLPRGISDAFKPDGELWRIIYKPQINTTFQGLYQIREGILMIASHSILTSNGTGPPHGTTILARYFNEDSIKNLRHITGLNLDFYDKKIIFENSDLKDIYNELINNGGDRIDKVSTNKLFAYSVIKDINNNPIAMIKIIMPRSIYETGVRTLNYFNSSLIISGLSIAILLFILLQVFVIRPLKNINYKIVEIKNNIKNKNDSNTRIPDKGKDELSSVGREANKMLDIVRQYNQEKEQLIARRGHELNSANEYAKKIQETEQLISGTINAMPSMLMIIDDQLMINEINDIAAQQIGRAPAQVKNKLIFDYFPYLTPYKENLLNCINKNKTEVINKIIYKDKKENTHYYSMIFYPLSQLQGKPQIAIRIDDIEEQEKLEERLIQNDKLASVGVLTAGVAHEINNPINFVSSAVSPLKQNIADIFNVINKYSEIKSHQEASHKLKEISELKSELNIDYVINETSILLEGIESGSKRISSIVKNLKLFTRFDEDKMKKTDLKDIVDSVLSLLFHRYKNRIKIIKDYENVPAIDCYPGQINQVVMNIITNAIDAIIDQGEIKIKLSQKNDNAVLSVKDSGMGIKEENISKIFDPFFTTKEVGTGMGMGLSISRSIILDHHGSIDVKSFPGEGCEFIITLPIEQRE